MAVSDAQDKDTNGRSVVLIDWIIWLPLAIVTLESWEQNATWLPEGEKETECTQPLVGYSAHKVPNGSFSPQTGFDALFLDMDYLESIPLIQPLKTRAVMSLHPAAKIMFSGCQSTLNTVLRIGFFKCFETHQLCSSSK